ncbi:unnamed protein product [Larinioides sclopetarius]|uniref:Uncharacterized protein n=1 Tax=Larinioides sclopetarius TaxID=280406 RepID=A0AAV2BIE5_9ARAC
MQTLFVSLLLIICMAGALAQYMGNTGYYGAYGMGAYGMGPYGYAARPYAAAAASRYYGGAYGYGWNGAYGAYSPYWK